MTDALAGLHGSHIAQNIGGGTPLKRPSRAASEALSDHTQEVIKYHFFAGVAFVAAIHSCLVLGFNGHWTMHAQATWQLDALLLLYTAVCAHQLIRWAVSPRLNLRAAVKASLRLKLPVMCPCSHGPK